MRYEFPVDAIWRAVLDGDDRAIAAIDFADSPVWLRVWRTESGPEIVGLSENERRVLAALFSGQPLHAALAETRGEQTHALRAARLATAYFENLDHEADGLAQSPEGQTTVSASHERHRRPIGLAVVMESFLACPGGLRARKAQRRKLPCAEDRLVVEDRLVTECRRWADRHGCVLVLLQSDKGASVKASWSGRRFRYWTGRQSAGGRASGE